MAKHGVWDKVNVKCSVLVGSILVNLKQAGPGALAFGSGESYIILPVCLIIEQRWWKPGIEDKEGL